MARKKKNVSEESASGTSKGTLPSQPDKMSANGKENHDSVKQPSASELTLQQTPSATVNDSLKQEKEPEPLKATKLQKVAVQSEQATQKSADEVEKPRSAVMSDRKAKKDAKKATKEAATLQKAAKPVAPATPKLNDKEEKQKDQKSRTSAISKAEEAQPVGGSAQDKQEKGILKVRFGFPSDNGKQHDEVPCPVSRFALDNGSNVHPSFRRLCAKCEESRIIGIDALCVAFIDAFHEFIKNYNPPPKKPMQHDLAEVIQPQLSCLSENGLKSFPLAFGNLIRQLKKNINQLPLDVSPEEGKEFLLNWISDFYKDNFVDAEAAVISFTLEKLRASSGCRRILTYSWSPLVQQIVLAAKNENIAVHVYVIDNEPNGQSMPLLRSLAQHDVPCTYGLLNSVSNLMDKCDIVLLGCSAILSNGSAVVSRGSSLLALNAQAKNIPLLIAAKSYQFVDKIRSFGRTVNGTRASLLSELLEVIPEDLITAVVTELRILPPSSAPAVLKAKQYSAD